MKMNCTHYIYNIALLLLLGAATSYAQTINGKIYGGGEIALVDGNTHVEVLSGKVGKPAGDADEFNGGVFGGGLGQTTVVTGNVEVLIGKDGSGRDAVGPTINGDVYGGSALGNTNCSAELVATADKTTNVALNAGTINGSMYGGALGQKNGVGDATSDIAANVYGPVQVTVNGGNVFTTDDTGVNGSGGVFGCNNLNGEPKSTVKVDVYGTNSHNANGPVDDYSDDIYAVFSVYGGGNQANYTIGTPHVTVHNCDNSIAYVYGGGNAAHLIHPTDGNTDVTIWGGNRIGNVFGGGNGQVQAANISGGTNVKIYGGSIGNVFGGSNSQGNIGGLITLDIDEHDEAGDGTSLCPLHAEYVFGGGNKADYIAPIGERGPEVTIKNGTIVHDVYGGGALANVTGNTFVYLKGGSVGGAYGGALGSEEVKAMVYGDTYVLLDGSKVTETGIFGANNLNGTPTGHVKVHVKSTTPREGEDYHVPAVYGGGNLSAYVPDNNIDFAEVLIENCDNSIEYVYGGGNAAPVPATQVVIKGAYSIKHAFAGGNGAGQSTDPSAANYNPGADVGYLGYRSSGTYTEYGSGLASITVNGGTVDNVYGGSNTLGFIRGGTSVSVANSGDTTCELNVGNVFGGGNEADIDCSVTINLDCNEGADILYAGANNANVNGDITLNISSGTFGQVFCGNNEGGNVKGNLVVNVDETGCQPVMIGELYACGNMAPYSVYGYNDDKNKTVKTEGPQLYNDPVINLISFTRIGAVFGGGYGATADLYGDTYVNVDVIPGLFADTDSAEPTYVLDANDNRVPNVTSLTDLPVGVSRVEGTKKLKIHNDIGTIGNIYGGGNQATVHGNTHILIGTEAVDSPGKHVTGTDAIKAMDAQPVGVTITGDVFGGGKTAIVTGDTHVTIGK